ncbi:MAG: hypothetical protein QM737_02845 [Ferruginibacter sp.]
MKKLTIATFFILSMLSCKKEKPEQNNNCGIVTSRFVRDCGISSCSINFAVDYPDGRSEAYVESLPLGSTKYSVGSQYCK